MSSNHTSSTSGYPADSDDKESACNAGDPDCITGLGRYPEATGSALQNFCLESSMDRGVWQAAVYGVAKSWTRLSDFTSLIFSQLDIETSKAIVRD